MNTIEQLVVSGSHREVGRNIGHHFIARSLLEAHSLEDAVGRVAIPARAAGFNYNIGSHAERRIISVEVSPEQPSVAHLLGQSAQGTGEVYSNSHVTIPNTDQTRLIIENLLGFAF